MHFGREAELVHIAVQRSSRSRRQCNAAVAGSATQRSQSQAVQRSGRRQCNAAVAVAGSATQRSQSQAVQRSGRRQCNAAVAGPAV
jgi:hypothetical protein